MTLASQWHYQFMEMSSLPIHAGLAKTFDKKNTPAQMVQTASDFWHSLAALTYVWRSPSLYTLTTTDAFMWYLLITLSQVTLIKCDTWGVCV